MGLNRKLVSQASVKNGDLFFEIYRYRPNDFSRISPQILRSVDLCGGQWGAVGSVIRWNYIHDGKPVFVKEIIEAIDEEKKSITYKAIEGDLLQVYKNFKFHIRVDTTGDDSIVTWTFEYEKSEGVPDPDAVMDLLLTNKKDFERQQSYLVPN